MIWQRVMIRLARNARVQEIMQSRAAFSGLARSFVGGATLEEAVDTCRALHAEGISASLFYMGEYLADPAQVSHTVERKRAAAAALADARLDVHVSVDPTQIGLLLSPARLRDNAQSIAEAVAGAATRVRNGRDLLMLDMEDQGVVDQTITLHRDLLEGAFPVGLTLQAYLRRTERDLSGLLESPTTVRLVKGAFAASRDAAFTGRAEIHRNYLDLARRMLSPGSAAAGFRPVFGTHDHRLIAAIDHEARTLGRSRDGYEIEMLYGVRSAYQRALVARGHRVRAYVPFGPDWWPYAARRVGESRKNLYLLLRAAAAALVTDRGAHRIGGRRMSQAAPTPHASQPA